VVGYRGVNVGNTLLCSTRTKWSWSWYWYPAIVRVMCGLEANQSGLISQVSVDITPLKPIPAGVIIAKPPVNCNRTLIVCDRSRLQGQIGISTDKDWLSASTRFAGVSDPAHANVNAAARNASRLQPQGNSLARDLSSLTSTQQQLGSFSTTANSVQRSAKIKSVHRLSNTANQFRCNCRTNTFNRCSKLIV